MDNFYTSPSLFLQLYRKGVNACCTVQCYTVCVSRKFYPRTLAYSKGVLTEGFYDYHSSGSL